MGIESFDGPNGPLHLAGIVHIYIYTHTHTHTHTQIDEIVVHTDEKRYADNVFVYML